MIWVESRSSWSRTGTTEGIKEIDDVRKYPQFAESKPCLGNYTWDEEVINKVILSQVVTYSSYQLSFVESCLLLDS